MKDWYLFRLLPLVAFQVLFICIFRLLTIAVVRFVIDDQNILHAHQVGHDTLDHLSIRLLRVQFLADTPLQELAPTLGQLHALAQLESVKIGDDDFGPVHVVQHVIGNDLATGLVAVGIIRLQDAKPIFDG